MAHAPKDESHAPASAPRDSDGLPAGLEAGVESLAGMAMDGVRVQHDSGRPAELGALEPSQEPPPPHEAWHVVRQGPGRTVPTRQAESAPIDDDPALEREADRMGAKAAAAIDSADDRSRP